MDKFDKIISEMSLDELVGQLLCYCVPSKDDDETKAEFETLVKRTKPGAIFFNTSSSEKIRAFIEIANRNLKIPVIVAGDTERGPNTIGDCGTYLPYPTAWGSADDDALIEEGGYETAKICRKSGIHWSFAPLVDILYNKNCAEGTRVISDSPDQVARMGSAYVRGHQKGGFFAACAKHFPGAGTDDRNPHFCNPENKFSKEEWDKTFGMVYKKMISDGVATIMTGHYTFPAYQSEAEYDEVYGYRPATLSYELTTKLLREELGFKGCIISDALSMVGAAAYFPLNRLAIETIKAGSDMALFPPQNSFDHLKKAVEDGEISIERIKESVKRVLELKERVSLFSDEEPEIELGDIGTIAQRIADKSIKIVRNAEGLIPINPKKDDTIFVVNHYCMWDDSERFGCVSDIEDMLRDRGFKTVSRTNPDNIEVKKVIDEYKPSYILVNARHSDLDTYGNSRHITWKNIMAFWRGTIFEGNKVIFTSFGDPCLIYELPFLKTYVNAFSPTKESKEAFLKVLFGEIEAVGKNPVDLKPFFEREV